MEPLSDPISQYRPAPEVEQRQIALAPTVAHEGPPDLDAMALHLDQMKIEAKIDAERTRPGLNGFFALVLAAGIGYAVLYVAQYQAQTVAAMAHGEDTFNPVRVAVALGIGLLLATVVGLWSFLVMRRTQRVVQAYEQHLLALGGTPLPERGLPVSGGRKVTSHKMTVPGESPAQPRSTP
jgi:hypothetical protein